MVPGDIFYEKFRILEILGKGGSGCVYLAQNLKLGSLWAIKQIPADSKGAKNPSIEPDILKKLEHPALPRIYDILEEKDFIYYIIDYIEGVPLDKMLSEKGGFPESAVIDWAVQLCEVLGYLHSVKPSPVIYRDMKPSNIILTKSGKLKLVDFGTAREYKQAADADTVFIGTRGYAAPEQYGRGQSDEKTDIYSLGVTLHHLLTGKGPNEPPYELKPVSCYKPELSEELERIISKCTRQDPGNRYKNVPELLADLNKVSSLRQYDSAVNGAGCVPPSGLGPGGIAGSKRRTVFKRLVLTIWGNPEFGCEFAYIAAKKSGCSVLLVDLDLLAPKADLFLNVKKYPGMVINEGILGNSGLNIAIEAAEKNMLTSGIIAEAAVKQRENGNLYVLTGNYKLDNYEYFNDESLLKLIDKAYAGFDITVLLAGKWIYDSYSVISLARSDYNIVPVRADIDALREFNSYIAFLKDKQQISPDKYKFVAYEYCSKTNLSISEVNNAVGGYLIGCVGASERRAALRNLKPAYVRHMEKDILDDYLKLLRWFNIIPEPGFRDILAKWCNAASAFLSRKKKDKYSTGESIEGGESDACYKVTSQASSGGKS